MEHKTVASRLALSAAAAMSLALPAMAGESVLYSFTSEANGVPEARLLLKGGALYGTVTSGGSGADGDVFELQNSGGQWQETTLFTFDGSDGQDPLAGLLAGPGGVLYGTSGTGGADQGGTVFLLKKSGKTGWTQQTIWNFPGYDQQPNCDLVMDSSGNIYGTTVQGGTYGYGIVFELSQSGGVWTETTLHNFDPNGTDGLLPFSGLLLDKTGTLFGTTYGGGANGGGTVYELVQSAGVWTESVIHSFGNGSGNDGQYPNDASLVEGGNGTLYGATTEGGPSDYGTVYELVPSGGSWTENILYNFTGGSDGGEPLGGILRGKGGVLYGTTASGGTHNDGTVFSLKKSGRVWTESVLNSFPSTAGDGIEPYAGVIQDKSTGTLYGTTAVGGAHGWGTVYQITP